MTVYYDAKQAMSSENIGEDNACEEIFYNCEEKDDVG